MKPIDFKEKNKVLKKPKSMTDEECSSMSVHTNGEQCISCWKGTFKDRIKFLFTGKVWIWVWSGQTQPPILAETKYPFARIGKIKWYKKIFSEITKVSSPLKKRSSWILILFISVVLSTFMGTINFKRLPIIMGLAIFILIYDWV